MGNANKRVFMKKALESKTEKASSNASAPTTAALTRHDFRWSDVAAGRKSTHPNAAPIKRIIDLPELLEHTLLQLPTQSLLDARGICRTFRDLIDTSPTLQKALFLQPNPTAVKQPWVLGGRGELFFRDKAADFSRDQEDQEIHAYIPMKLNAFAVNEVALSAVECLNDTLQIRTQRFLKKGGSSVPFRIDPFNCNLSALCRKMYLSQPPIRKVKVRFWGRFRYVEDRRGLPKSFEGYAGEKIIENEGGLTVDDVVKAVQHPGGWIYCELGRPQLDRLFFLDALAVTEEEVAEVEMAGNS